MVYHFVKWNPTMFRGWLFESQYLFYVLSVYHHLKGTNVSKNGGVTTSAIGFFVVRIHIGMINIV